MAPCCKRVVTRLVKPAPAARWRDVHPSMLGELMSALYCRSRLMRSSLITGQERARRCKSVFPCVSTRRGTSHRRSLMRSDTMESWPAVAARTSAVRPLASRALMRSYESSEWARSAPTRGTWPEETAAWRGVVPSEADLSAPA